MLGMGVKRQFGIMQFAFSGLQKRSWQRLCILCIAVEKNKANQGHTLNQLKNAKHRENAYFG